MASNKLSGRRYRGHRPCICVAPPPPGPPPGVWPSDRIWICADVLEGPPWEPEERMSFIFQLHRDASGVHWKGEGPPADHRLAADLYPDLPSDLWRLKLYAWYGEPFETLFHMSPFVLKHPDPFDTGSKREQFFATPAMITARATT